MRILKVIESRIWKNAATGASASIYGALPYLSNASNEWSIVANGWTWEMDNNTIGLGRVPMKTEAEAVAFMVEWNNRLDDAARESLPGMIEANKEAVTRARAWLAEADYPAAKRGGKRTLKEALARLAGCEARLAELSEAA